MADRPVQNPGALPNYDTDRNTDPGLTITASPQGLITDDPAAVQVWRFPASTTTLDGPVTLTLWIAPDGPLGPGPFLVRAGLFDCDLGRTACTLLVRDDPTVTAVADTFAPVAFDLSVSPTPYVVAAGRRLELRVATRNGSSNDGLFAYDAVDYPSELIVTSPPAPAVPAGMPANPGSAPATPAILLVLAALAGVAVVGRRPSTDATPAPA